MDEWLDANIDSLFMNLDNKQKYLKAVGVRGHDWRLKDKAKKYLMEHAEKLLLNKKRRARSK